MLQANDKRRKRREIDIDAPIIDKYDREKKRDRERKMLTLSEGMVRTVVIVTDGQEASCRE